MNSIRAIWEPPPKTLRLYGHVHVWRVEFDSFSLNIVNLLNLLNPEERARAERFYFDKDRDRFIVARAVLRIILSYYLKMAPEKIQFNYNAYGKPSLSEELFRSSKMRFNLSHSKNMILYAVTEGREVGIDVEHLDYKIDELNIARRFFSAQEFKELTTVPEALRRKAFFYCWTRKEAFIKAIGEGLSVPLDSFDVSLKPGEPARLLRIRNSSRQAARWSMFSLHPAKNYVAALVVEGKISAIKLFNWFDENFCS